MRFFNSLNRRRSIRRCDVRRQHGLLGGETVKQQRPSRRRRGATSVEFALVAIPMFLFIFATVEFGRTMMALESMEEAARCGAREAILAGATTEKIETEVHDIMSLLGLEDEEYTVEISPANLSAQERWSPVTVTINATFDDVSWLPVPMYLGNVPLSASATLAKECPPEES